MHYRKYHVRSALFALRNPRLSAQVLATFSGARPTPLPPPPPKAQASKRD